MYEVSTTDITGLASTNEFMQTMYKSAYTLGQRLVPFGLFLTDLQSKSGVTSLLKLPALADKNKVLVKEIEEYWKNELGMPDLTSKYAVIDYLLSVSACYCEVPKIITKEGVVTPTYEKFVATRNVGIISAWLGISLEEAVAKYQPKLRQMSTLAYSLDNIYCIKLNIKAGKGNTVTVPRTTLDYSKMTIIPLCMLDAYIKGFKTQLSSNIVKFTYEKDNNTARELCTTTSEEIVRKYYTNTAFADKMLAMTDLDNLDVCSLQLPSSIFRGYARVPELGSSIYDETGSRSLNVSRLLKMEIVDTIDTTFINVDLSAVVDRFINAVNSTAIKNPSVLHQIFVDVIGQEPTGNQVATLAEGIGQFVRGRDMLLSTTYRRSLHLYAVTHIDLLPDYLSISGTASGTVSSGNNNSAIGITYEDDF